MTALPTIAGDPVGAVNFLPFPDAISTGTTLPVRNTGGIDGNGGRRDLLMHGGRFTATGAHKVLPYEMVRRRFDIETWVLPMARAHRVASHPL